MSVCSALLNCRIAGGCCRVWRGVPRPRIHIRSASVAESGTRRSDEEQLWEAEGNLPFSRAKIGPFFQERPLLKNPFLEDALLRGYLRRHLPQEAAFTDLCAFGERVANEVDGWGRECEATPPRLVHFDPWGRRVDHIVTSPTWKRMKELSAQEGLVAIGYERPCGEWSRVYQMSKLYIFSPSSGLYTCPLAMTDGAAKVIQSIDASWLVDEAYSRLTTRQPERFWTSGQWMTERQGGSDVASGTETVAVPQTDGSYKLHGFKWFTSATDADMTLTLARIQDRTGATTPGSRGLSLFYAEVSRDEEGQLKGIEVQRLKDKLGTRQMPTAELLLDGLPAHRLSEEGRGVASIANMLTITRIHNSVSAVAAMRRVVQLARDYATRRTAFGKLLKEHPLHMQTLARMEVETRGAFLLVMDVCRLLGREESGMATQLDTHLLRLLTPVVKLYTGKQAVAVVSEGLESFGGQGYIEDTGLPGLLRDAQVLSIWEGTTNVLSLDVLRSVARSSGMVLHAYFTHTKSLLASASSVSSLAPMIHVPEKLPESKVTPVPRLPTVPPPESVSVIPLSDSPPPSRWKPGQKPWKPSYIHIQEIKAKVAPSNISFTGQAADSVTEKAQTSVKPKCPPGNSESDKGHKPAGRSQSRSSRSMSYSRSYSCSRSRSYSRSGSRSPYQYNSRSSSYSRSGSENSHKTSNKKNSLDKEWKEYYSSLKRIKDLDKYIALASSQDVQSGSENRAGCEHSPDFLEKIKEKVSSQDQETKHYSSMPAENFHSRSEWDSDSDKVSQSNSATLSKKQKRAAPSSEILDKKLSAVTGWNSESDSENITARKLAISEKEEGEASSESEHETFGKTSEAEVAAAAAGGQSEESPEKAAEPEKHKSKKKAKRKHKHKRRSENKSGSHHSKDKRKRSKRKHQKLKETFHWQPPLEFGEEEEDDESKRERHSPGRVVKERPGVDSTNEKHQCLTSLTKNPPREDDKGQQRPKECISKNPKHAEPHLQSSNRNGANLPSINEQESLDDMDICTPEHDIEIVEPPVTQDSHCDAPELTIKSTSKSSDISKDSALPHSKEQPSVTSTTTAAGLQDEATTGTVSSFKWRPLKGMSALQSASVPPVTTKSIQLQESQTPNARGVRMEIKSKSRVRPGSLFDEVRKTARLNQRPRNQESSSEESSPSVGKMRGTSRTRSPKKSRSASRKSHSVSSHRSHSRGWSHSYSRSRSRSRSSSYSSRSRSRSRRRHGRGRSRSRSSTYRSYRSHSRTYSRSHSRSRSYNRRRRSRSDSYDSYSSRSVSRRRGYRRSDSYRSSDRRSRSSRSSSRSSSRRRSHSRSSRYS